MPKCYRAVLVLMAVLVFLSAGLAQNRGALAVTAEVRSSVLFSGSTPAGMAFSQGGEQSASVIMAAAFGAQSFSTRAVVANNPNSRGYDLLAKRTGQGSVTVDGMELSSQEKVIAAQAEYGILQTHSIQVSGPDAVTIILTCRPK